MFLSRSTTSSGCASSCCARERVQIRNCGLRRCCCEHACIHWRTKGTVTTASLRAESRPVRGHGLQLSYPGSRSTR
eukprot:972891-Rhodomonas_salina.1